MAKVLSIVAPDNFQQFEFLESKRALEAGGHEVVMASSSRTPTDKAGKAYRADLLLSEVLEKDFDVVLFVGGPGVYAYFDNSVVLGIARDFYEAGKLTTAICAAPTILARAGLLKGKKATCFPSEVTEIQTGGGTVSSAHVEQDGLIITADGPESAKAFGALIAGRLK